MTDCPRDWREGDGCAGCWAHIFHRLTVAPSAPILPRPEFCQDAAFVAYVLDYRLATIQHPVIPDPSCPPPFESDEEERRAADDY